MGEIKINGISSKTIGLEVETYPNYVAPKRSYETVHVPGRNGDLVFDNGCYENVRRSYEVSIGSHVTDYTTLMRDVMDWLHRYVHFRLEDSYEPDYYRIAFLPEEVEFSNLFHHGGKATLEFECKPQRFLNSGRNSITYTASGGSITNPTWYDSEPLIRIYCNGDGKVTIGSYYTINVKGITDYVDIDSEIQDAYSGEKNMNGQVEVYGGFPILEADKKMTITTSGNVTKLEVTPRWYVI